MATPQNAAPALVSVKPESKLPAPVVHTAPPSTFVALAEERALKAQAKRVAERGVVAALLPGYIGRSKTKVDTTQARAACYGDAATLVEAASEATDSPARRIARATIREGSALLGAKAAVKLFLTDAEAAVDMSQADE